MFDDQDKKQAAALIEEYGLSHGLRTLDAMQLAMINKLGVDAVTLVYCADRQFARIVEQEGFTVRNPEELSIEDDASIDSPHD